MSSFRESSKEEWNSRTTVADINAGSLQRIADATELMAKNYAALIDERDRYKRYLEEMGVGRTKLRRRIQALRGVITRLKRAAQAGKGGAE